MSVKLAVMRISSGKFYFGDVVDATDIDTYMGDKVEPIGGPFAMMIIDDLDPDDELVQLLKSDWMVANPAYVMGDTLAAPEIPHSKYLRRHFLKPTGQDDPFVIEMVKTGQTHGKKQDLLDRLVTRDG